MHSQPGGVRKGAMTLAVAGFIDYGLQFLVPMVLVRTLSVEEYGEYRLLWLITTTALAFAHLNIPQGLYFFLAREGGGERGAVVANSMAFMATTAIIAAVCFLVLGRHFFHGSYSFAMPVFLGLWIFAYLLDVLPVADGNPVWQARTIVGLAVLRTLLLSAAAILSHDLVPILYALLIGAAVKSLMVFVYARRAFGFSNLQLSASMFRTQIRYAMPFALASMAFFLRGQADQWIVTGLFSVEKLAVMSVAAAVLPITTLMRRPIISAVLPPISAAMQRGSLDVAKNLVKKTNAASTLFLFPLLGFLFTCADEVVSIVYTDTYREAAAIMRIYLVGMTAGAFASGHLLVAMDRGGSSLRIHVLCLAVSFAVGLLGATHFGLEGAALGSMTGLVIAEIMFLHVAARAMGTRPVDLVPWHIVGKLCIAILAAGTLSQLSKIGLNLAAGEAVTALVIQSAIYFFSLAIGVVALGLWQEIEEITALKLTWSSTWLRFPKISSSKGDGKT